MLHQLCTGVAEAKQAGHCGGTSMPTGTPPMAAHGGSWGSVSWGRRGDGRRGHCALSTPGTHTEQQAGSAVQRQPGLGTPSASSLPGRRAEQRLQGWVCVSVCVRLCVVDSLSILYMKPVPQNCIVVNRK